MIHVCIFIDTLFALCPQKHSSQASAHATTPSQLPSLIWLHNDTLSGGAAFCIELNGRAEDTKNDEILRSQERRNSENIDKKTTLKENAKKQSYSENK